MSKIFGPVVQQGYVVPDMQAALDHWVARGVGPFYIMDDIRLPSEYYGEAEETHIAAAFAMSGDQQIELIHPYADSGRTIYADYLKDHPEGGLQHLAVWVDDVDEKLASLKDDGVDYTIAHRYINSHAYLDLPHSPGVMIQLMPHDDVHIKMFGVFAEGAASWDGTTDPVRPYSS